MGITRSGKHYTRPQGVTKKAPRQSTTNMYRHAVNSANKTDSVLAIADATARVAREEETKLLQAHSAFPSELQTAVINLGKSVAFSAAANAVGVPPLVYAMASLAYGLTSAAAAPIPQNSNSNSTFSWVNKFAPTRLQNLCTAKNFGDRCGRSHLIDETGNVLLPAVTREIDAYTTNENFSWGMWFTLKDCYTKSKVQNTITGLLESLGLDKALTPGLICSTSSNKFKGTLMTTSVEGLSVDACVSLTSQLNNLAQKCNDGARAGAIDFGLTLAAIAGIVLTGATCLGGAYIYQNRHNGSGSGFSFSRFS